MSDTQMIYAVMEDLKVKRETYGLRTYNDKRANNSRRIKVYIAKRLASNKCLQLQREFAMMFGSRFKKMDATRGWLAVHLFNSPNV